MLASLTRLVVDNNSLRKLPDVILKLPSLAVLQAAANTITHLPECLEQMPSLQGLILSTNQVCSAWEGCRMGGQLHARLGWSWLTM